MKVIKKGEGSPYEAPKHFKYWSMNKITPDTASKQLTIGVSHFLPGGGAEMSASQLERVYYCLTGSIIVKGKTEEYRLNQDDLIYIAPGEERSFQNPSTTPATILVIMTKIN